MYINEITYEMNRKSRELITQTLQTRRKRYSWSLALVPFCVRVRTRAERRYEELFRIFFRLSSYRSSDYQWNALALHLPVWLISLFVGRSEAIRNACVSKKKSFKSERGLVVVVFFCFAQLWLVRFFLSHTHAHTEYTLSGKFQLCGRRQRT